MIYNVIFTVHFNCIYVIFIHFYKMRHSDRFLYKIHPKSLPFIFFRHQS